MCVGDIPSWLNGQLVRIGPGLFEFGEFEADGMGLLHAFNIQDGGVTFKSRSVWVPIFLYSKPLMPFLLSSI